MGADRVDVVVIGAGLAGSAAACALARRGRSVVVLEAFQPGHRHGSSHGSARIFRRAYLHALYVRLTGEAHRLWRQLADEAGEELIRTTGWNRSLARRRDFEPQFVMRRRAARGKDSLSDRAPGLPGRISLGA
jgi:glycine/D-amino acid oxidase-like deaminating enzyme